RYPLDVHGPESPRHVCRDATGARLSLVVEAGISRHSYPIGTGGAALNVASVTNFFFSWDESPEGIGQRDLQQSPSPSGTVVPTRNNSLPLKGCELPASP